MQVVEKNEGAKIEYELNGSVITFGGALMLNLEKYERDSPNHIDICTDKYGCMVCGAATGSRYVAQIDIPARGYIMTAATAAAADEVDDEGDGSDRVPAPFDVDACTLTLWAVEE